MTIRAGELMGVPGFHEGAIGGMKEIDQSFASRSGHWRCVTEAFALELYLKAHAVLNRADKTHLMTHNLRTLFDDLTPDTQKLIKDHAQFSEVAIDPAKVAEAAKVPALTDSVFDTCLSASRDAFVQLRYIHQQNDAGKSWLARHIMQAARVAVVVRQPTWKPQTAHFLPTSLRR